MRNLQGTRGLEIWSSCSEKEIDDRFHRRSLLGVLGPGGLDQFPEGIRKSELDRFHRSRRSPSLCDFEHNGRVSFARVEWNESGEHLPMEYVND